jgi:hypothetical protein
MRDRRAGLGQATHEHRSRDDILPRVELLCASLAVAAAGGGCDDSEPPRVYKQTPEEGHLWDTEDPGAAQAPRGIVVAFVLICALAALLYLTRRRRGRAGRGRGGAPSRTRGRGRPSSP